MPSLPAAETHAAFTGAIVSLCLGGPAVMVFRRDGHTPRALFLPPRSLLVMAGERAAPPSCAVAGCMQVRWLLRCMHAAHVRSCLGIVVMRACLTTRVADEARYAWQHYIPHRKSDLVASASGAGEPEVVHRAPRRVSFTFRQVHGASGF